MAILKPGQRLKALIEQSGYSITTIAQKIGYTREHLSRLLKSNKVDELLVWKISNSIGVDLMPEVFPDAVPERDDCAETVARLQTELTEARETIRDLSAALRHLSEKTDNFAK
jgi:transcriptional regulator with XRE-family HTH domain